MQNLSRLDVNTPTLPSGGGAISGLKSDMAGAGPDGAASLSIPLPVSAGRGYAPPLALSYHSRAGNGAFGIGWQAGLASVRRRTRKGVPGYDSADEFLGPEGDVLVPVLKADSSPEIRRSSELFATALESEFLVTAYRSRTESSFSRLEYWRAENSDFWLLYSPEGEVHLLGRNPQARIANPREPAKNAVWLLESSVSATGEQIWYQYRAEDDLHCDRSELALHPEATAQRYLVAAWYGNSTAGRTLPGLVAAPRPADWLFTLVLDYGERGTALAEKPGWLLPGSGSWLCRQDRFSSYEYGFDLRTRRLCRQVLMYHRLATLAGKAAEDETPELVARLLLEYAESPAVTTLQSVRQAGYESDGSPLALPPLTFDWQTFTPPASVTWQQRDDLQKFTGGQYQLVDLHGEGLAGILYQDNEAWWYRAPVRQAEERADAVTWDRATPLPVVPALRDNGMLTDLNGDGRLEWVVTLPGVAGRYEREPERSWRPFTPLSALPVEYSHPQAQLADILGGGLTDMVLIGPSSVRLYGGTGDGWRQGETVVQSAGVVLPIAGADARALVAFSDMLGSGQQHLVEIRAGGVRCWPNLGHGRFGQPLELPGFNQPYDTFNPDQLSLADVDGSGTTDLIYAHSDRLEIWLNQSGNGFAAPFSIPLPSGIRYDRTCSLQLADVQGLGIASFVLTVPHPTPRSWICHLSEAKPWLLCGVNNNMGSCHQLFYRSSAQFWLDEKAEAAVSGKATPFCYLPFALHTLWKTQMTDEITGNRLVSEVRYRRGVWDSRERELRGFARVDIFDTHLTSRGTAKAPTFPSLQRNWYATGLPEVDGRLADEFWQGDSAAYAAFTPRFTLGWGEDEQAYHPDDATASWLNRALQGRPLRSELYGLDDSDLASTPYRVTEHRPQVRLVQAAGIYPVVWATEVETRSWVYERVSCDPQCEQQILLVSDEFGQPLKQVSINYPRRPQPAESPYPDSLPETLFASSYDPQQQLLRLTLQQSSWHHLTNLTAHRWLPGLANAVRSDIFTHSASAVPSGGVSLELLRQSAALLAEETKVFAGQQQIVWLDERNGETTIQPAWPPRVAFTETAVFDKEIVQAITAYVTPEQLRAAGYQQAARLFAQAGEEGVWTARQGYTTWHDADHFWLPCASRTTLLTGAVTITRDAHDCVITQVQDAAGLTTTADYDWRFLTPVRITDVNDNLHIATLDALGRVITTRFSGTENGEPAGYSEAAFVAPKIVDEALALTAPLPVAQCLVYVTDSWMQAAESRIPPHALTLLTDRYDNDPQQQIRQQVTFSDGFGRVLQSASRQADGEAWQRADNGSLIGGTEGGPAVAESRFRWAVSGRTEYDHKGQPVRTYQPYFLNSWKYVSDDSARQDLYADTHYYDPLGREYQVVTAKGWLRRSLLTPWFVVSEDENDTAATAS
ncbi:SpvB/TcaC N-terminal domain-containing protein [Kalamiella sp. sgz302252]|uniref:SpvB/TcaC N-terminal domain-containing protein n=1 Tax=Pantoea sp. sgz302252 TaxID=3341827 RepID=UPI0036D30B07